MRYTLGRNLCAEGPRRHLRKPAAHFTVASSVAAAFPSQYEATTECYTDIADESAGVRAVTVTSRPVLDIDPTALIAAPVDAAFDPAMCMPTAHFTVASSVAAASLAATTECYTDIADESAGVRAVTVTSRPVLDIDPTALIAAPVDAAFDPAMFYFFVGIAIVCDDFYAEAIDEVESDEGVGDIVAAPPSSTG
ncbi:Hypothetical protein EMIHUDRAFT_256062 [Emiliania huxleyi CCMP1516]|uniref:Uncharacterized protein n=2 Tax=Emiliania huxleyi TaxID=2903 RepID=A0A0D3J0E4_EMIH1|nr:Hypothetical protein EMIHUDRAFT_256062 [Emiliania huxleyi CCMP1516]EOD16979.1 Hypothetical protein EMIHUDRAFT_256062 [Emiliania huxleyi CCMP1516]|eukprot:XP_005769408.1 Hypothetical protein EMIHUDRAFT_256062 [Emiliania huxleyi CCMP1516]